MGFIDDVLQGAGRGAEAAGNFINDNTALGSQAEAARRLAAIHRFAADHGFPLGAADPRFAAQYPDLAQEAWDLNANVAAMVGSGAMGAANRAAEAAPGTLGSAAREAAQAARPQPGLPGMGTQQGTMPQPQFHAPQGANPNVPPAVNPPSSQLPLPTAPPPAPPSTMPSPNPANAQGLLPTPPVGGGNFLGQPAPPSGGPFLGQPPAVPPPTGGPFLGSPASATAASGPLAGLSQDAIAWIKANPRAALTYGVGAAVVAAATAYAGLNGRPDAASATPTPPARPEQDQNFAPDIGREYGDKNAQAAGERARALATAAMNPQQRADLDLNQSQADYYKANHDKLEQEMANMDLTDSQKEDLRHKLDMELHAADHAATSADVATVQSGESARNAASNASSERVASGNNATSLAVVGQQEAGANSRTAASEAGANTRNAATNATTERGQDVQDRAARLQYVVSQAANLVARGTLTEKKAHDYVSDYLARERLPSDILKQVSDAVTPMLKYLGNGNPGEDIPYTGEGSGSDLLYRAAGGKGHLKAEKYSAFNLMDLAKQYGGGPGQSRAPVDVEGAYAQVGDQSDQAAAAADRQSYADSAPQSPMVQGLVQQAQQATPPMDPETEKRIYAGMR